jgi:hypothetical protein
MEGYLSTNTGTGPSRQSARSTQARSHHWATGLVAVHTAASATLADVPAPINVKFNIYFDKLFSRARAKAKETKSGCERIRLDGGIRPQGQCDA